MKEEKQKEANYEFHFFLAGKTNDMKILTSNPTIIILFISNSINTDVLYFDPFTKAKRSTQAQNKSKN